MKSVRILLVLLLAALAQAHVGSADIYLDAQAGPYQLFVTVRPPDVIPGVAQMEIRAKSAGIHEIKAVPVPLTTAGAQFAPVADTLKVSPQDAQFFTGSLWMMTSGSWQVRITVNGAQGRGMVAVPVPAIAQKTKPMQSGMAVVLFVLMCLLVAGLVLLVGASVRESKLPSGVQPGPEDKRRARVAMAVCTVVVLTIVGFGRYWWNTTEANYETKVYKPLTMASSLSPSGELTLRLSNPAWMNRPNQGASPNGVALFTRSMDDLVPDHEHLMHLYAIREPGMDAVYHLHPEQSGTGIFHLDLPKIRAGSYRLYADVVHANGFPETMVSQLKVPDGLAGRPLRGDDAEGSALPWRPATETTTFRLADGYTMQWLRPSEKLRARIGIPMRFQLLDRDGRPASGMEFYMGMLGHAAFVKTDASTFAHIHPTGSVAMASYMLAQSQLGQTQTASMDMAGMDMPGMKMPASLPNEVTFPYGFPAAGQYRIFVQMKHSGIVETGVFDTLVVQ